MLELTIADEKFDEATDRIIKVNPFVVRLEHSLVSASKWEMKYHKSFFDTVKTGEELVYYIKCMITSQNISDAMFNRLITNRDALKQINAYINDPMTATSFSDRRITNGAQAPKKNYVTTEQIYSAMCRYNIPYNYEKWHLNRLLVLIKVRRIEETGGNDKLSKKDVMARQRATNAAARARRQARG